MFPRTMDYVMAGVFLLGGVVCAFTSYASANDGAWLGYAMLSVLCVVVAHAFILTEE